MRHCSFLVVTACAALITAQCSPTLAAQRDHRGLGASVKAQAHVHRGHSKHQGKSRSHRHDQYWQRAKEVKAPNIISREVALDFTVDRGRIAVATPTDVADHEFRFTAPNKKCGLSSRLLDTFSGQKT